MPKKLLATWMKTADFNQFENQLTLLWELGHLSQYESYEDARGAIRNRSHPDFQDAAISYQSFSQVSRSDRFGLARSFEPLDQDAYFGPETAKSVGQRFCSCPDILPAGAQSKWSFNDLTVWWRGPNDLGFSSFNEVKAEWIKAVGVWGQYTPLTVRWWQESDGGNGPNIYCDTFRIDGPNNVLAYMYLPSANAPRTEQNQMVADSAENWQQNSWFFPRVIEHEAGHAMGLGHIRNTASEKALMNPYIQELDGPQRLDIAAIQALYGKRPTDPTDPKPPPPKPGEIKWTVQQTTTDGRVVRVTTELVE